MDNIRITKIKDNGDTVIIEYKQKIGKSGWAKIAIEQPERARPEFYDALKQLASHVVQICELPQSYKDDIDVTGATFSYDDDTKTVGATIIAKKKLAHSQSPFNIATPHKFEHAANAELKGDKLIFLTPGAANDLRILRDEAIQYIKGERAQGDLFKGNGQAKKAKKEEAAA